MSKEAPVYARGIRSVAPVLTGKVEDGIEVTALGSAPDDVAPCRSPLLVYAVA